MRREGVLVEVHILGYDKELRDDRWNRASWLARLGMDHKDTSLERRDENAIRERDER